MFLTTEEIRVIEVETWTGEALREKIIQLILLESQYQNHQCQVVKKEKEMNTDVKNLEYLFLKKNFFLFKGSGVFSPGILLRFSTRIVNNKINSNSSVINASPRTFQPLYIFKMSKTCRYKSCTMLLIYCYK